MQLNNTEGAVHASTVNEQFPCTTQASAGHFDDRIDEVLLIAKKLILSKGVFHITLHFSSSQLTCCTLDNPYSMQIYNADEVFAKDFMRKFATLESKLHTRIDRDQVQPILNALKWLRCKEQGSELRYASLHMITGYIGLGFACDDTRYINFQELILPTQVNYA